MGKVIFYAACSLDGFLARKDDDFSWLNAYGLPEDFGFADFMKHIGPIIMGSRTYEVILKDTQGAWPYQGHPAYVMTRRRDLPKPEGADIHFVSTGLDRLTARLKKGRKDVWHVGGGLSLAPFLNAGLLDEIQLFVFPLLLKEGKPAFTDLKKEISLHLVESKPSRSGVVLLHYRKGKPPRAAKQPSKPAPRSPKTRK